MLSFEELSTLPNASVSCEAEALSKLSDAQLKELNFSQENIEDIRASALESHMEKIQNKDKTYQGFLNNDETLSYEELLKLPNTSVVSELNVLKKLKEKSVEELKTLGLQSEKIAELKNKNVEEIILDNVAKCSYEELLEKGLSKEAIASIKNHEYSTISDEEIVAASASLAFNIASISRAGTSVNYSIYWHWSSEPIIKYTDYVAGNISDGYWATGQCTAKLTYKDSNGYLSDYVSRIVPYEFSSNGCSFAFPMGHYTSQGPMWCQAGKAFIATQGNYSPNWALIANAGYFHSWAPEGLTISIGSGNISFSGNGSQEGASTVYIN